MHRNYISLVERGLQNITVETLFKLTVVLDCSPIDLFIEMGGRANASDTTVTSACATPYPMEKPSVWRVAEAEPSD